MAWLFSHLDVHALVLGGVWTVLGVVWLTVLTRGFRTPPPELEFEE
ncbi:hypothetical protein [Agilicoccus flavus]|nr:hypothetical protein [Agilicoccus flavus]